MQRRCYWMLDPNFEAIVLVHYLNVRSSKPQQQPWAKKHTTGELHNAQRPTASHNVNLSFSEGASASSFSAANSSLAVESPSGSFTITTGHTARPVAEFRLNSKASTDTLGQRWSMAEAVSSLPPNVGGGPGPVPQFAVPPQRSPFLASPPHDDHGFDHAVLNLNRGGTLPAETMPPPAARDAEHTARSVVSAFASRPVRKTSTAFTPYNSTTSMGRRTSEPAVSAFE